VKRLVVCHQQKYARRLERRYGFKVLNAVPAARLRQEAGNPKQTAENRARLARFFTEFWPRVMK
jgi:hypothetical protein